MANLGEFELFKLEKSYLIIRLKSATTYRLRNPAI